MADIKEDEFVVINKKFLRELAIKAPTHGTLAVADFVDALNTILLKIKIATGKDLSNHKYIVCNKDEPYADKVLQTILEGEDLK